MKAEITFMVQARVGSTRLPNKILLPFYNGKCILELLIDKLKLIENTNIVIATSKDSRNDAIEKIAQKKAVTCFRGSENDVLQRFIDAADYIGAKKLIRICSDNPFLELDSIKSLVKTAINSNKDYISFNINGKPSIKTHYGFWTEYVTLEALKKVKDIAHDSIYHEHVTNYIYSHPNLFNIGWIEGPSILNSHPHIRLTTDTKEDFNTVQEIYSALCKENPFPTIDQVVAFLDKHKDYYTIMEQQIEKNSK